MGSEREFKFRVPPNRLAALKAEVGSGDAERAKLLAVYFDTPDGLLASKGVVLRLRNDSGRWSQTVKAKGEGPLERVELESDLGALAEMPVPDLAPCKGTGVAKLLGGSLSELTERLEAKFQVGVNRTRRVVTQGASRIEAALDEGTVSLTQSASAASDAVLELELELIEGEVADLAMVAKDWLARHALSLGSVSKAGRGQRLLNGSTEPPAVKAGEVVYPPGCSRLDGAEVQRRVMAACLSQILPNASEIAAGNLDHEIVHQLRVGIRRLRTALRELDLLDPGRFVLQWEEQLKRCFDALGKSRDRELLETRMQPSLEKRGGPKVDFGKKPAAQALDVAVRDVGFQSALVDLLAFCSPTIPAQARQDGTTTDDADEVRPTVSAGPRKTRKNLAQRLNDLHKKVTKRGKKFEVLPAEDQHRVRKQLKRLRYLAEFVGPLFDRKRAARYIEHLTPAQDALGEHNDAHVALASYRERLAKDPHALFAIGWLTATLEHDAQACRAAIGEIASARKFWKEDS